MPGAPGFFVVLEDGGRVTGGSSTAMCPGLAVSCADGRAVVFFDLDMLDEESCLFAIDVLRSTRQLGVSLFGLQQSLGIQNQKQAAIRSGRSVQFGDTRQQFPLLPGNILRYGFANFFRHVKHVSDLIDQKADGSILRANYYVHGDLAVRSGMQAKPATHVDRGDDLPTEVD